MADRSLRGIRLGAQSLQSEEGVVFPERADYTYRCTTCGRDTTMTFSADAEVPEAWECRTAVPKPCCSSIEAGRDRPLGREGRAHPLGHAARAPHPSPSSKSSSKSASPTSAPAAAPAEDVDAEQAQRLTRSSATPVPSGAGVFATSSASRVAPRRAMTPRRRAPRGCPQPMSILHRSPETTAGVSPVRSGTSVSMCPAHRPAARRSSCRPGRSPGWCRRSRGSRPSGPSRSPACRANASCCRFSSVPRKSALFVWNM